MYMTKFLKNEMKKASETIRKKIKENKKLPAHITMNDSAGKSHKVDKKYYAGLFEARNIFILKHGREPNYVTLNNTANNPLVIDYQNNKYNCCPTSLSMASQMLYSYVSEQKCAKILKTNTNGTDPNNLINNAPRLGFKVTPISRNKSSVSKSLNNVCPVIAHIQTKPATCLNYVNDYGHYILIYSVTATGLYKVADPTKGLKTCKPAVLDKATNGRDIKYYSVSLI